MKTKIMNLRGGACVVCGEPSEPFSGVGGVLSQAQNVFFGVPDGKQAMYSLCHEHAKICLKGAEPSGFPCGELLVEAIKNAVESYDHRDDIAADEQQREMIEKKLAELDVLIEAGFLPAALELVGYLLNEMQQMEWEPRSDFDYVWTKEAAILTATGRHNAAIIPLRKSIEYRARTFGESARETLEARLLMAQAYSDMNRHIDALSVVEPNLPAIEQIKNKKLSMQAWQIMAKGCAAKKRYTDARKYLELACKS
jgi:tetratricopeptide (TPR) repeat protein